MSRAKTVKEWSILDFGEDELVEVARADVPAGTELFECTCCNRLRHRKIPICPSCRCPEFRLVKMLEEGVVVVDREFTSSTRGIDQ